MKKYIRLIVALVTILTLTAVFTVCATAVEPTNEGGHWVINAEKIDEILAGEAGEKTTGWEVPFMNVAPTLDGKITNGEYYPFELYEDYMSWMAINVGNTKEEFMEFYEMTKQDFFDAYWGWDGRYLYLAFEVRCVNGFKCTPEDMGGNVYLYAYNMMQLGIAPVDATGKHPDYVELGFGVHSETGESLTHTWMGPYYPVAGEDFVGSYDKEDQVVIYEARVHLQTALGLDRTVENGDEINFAWLLSVNGATSSVNDYWQVGFCHGIGGQYSNKQNQYFARVTFAGKDIQLDPEQIAGVSEEDKLYELVEFVDMSDEKTVNSFSGENASIEYITEDGESFARITALGEVPYVWSKTYPRSLQSAECSYIVVKYRYSGEGEANLGILYRNAYFPDYDLENMYDESVGGDGEWHTVTFYMFGEEKWQNWIVNMGLAPFAGEDASGKTIDIAFVKYYNLDPYELYKDQEYDPNKQEETTEPLPETTPADEVPTEEATKAPDQDTAVEDSDTAPAEETEASEKSGCGATVGFGVIAALALGAVLTLKKKED